MTAFSTTFVPGVNTHHWDLDGDGEYDDFAGETVSLTGVDGPDFFQARVRITDPDGFAKTFSGAVPVNNVAPTVEGSIPERAVAGMPLSFSLTSQDAALDLAAGFTWTENWGDTTTGSTGVGAPAAKNFLHTYTQPGFQREIAITVSDKDGGTSQIFQNVFVHSGVIGVFDGATTEADFELRHAVDSFSFFRNLGEPQDRILTLLNRSAASASFGPITVPNGFSLVNPPSWPVVLQAGQSLQVTLRFNAAAYGISQGNFQITTSDPLLPIFQLGLSGEVESPDITVNNFNQESYDLDNYEGFYSISPGIGASNGEVFNIESSGPPLQISSIELPAGFRIANAPTFPLIINNDDINIRIQSEAATNSLIKGWVRIYSNDPNESPFEFYVMSQSGNSGDLVVVKEEEYSSFNNQYSAQGVILNNQTTPLAFALPDTSSQAIRLVNQGNVAITVTSATLPTGYAFASLPSFPIVLSAYANTTLPSIILTAVTPGLHAGSLVITSNDPDEPSYNVPLRAEIAGAGGGISFASVPSTSPATGVSPARFSSTIVGTPGAIVDIEVSRDLGVSHPWQVIHTFTIGGTGTETLTNIVWPDSEDEPKGFFRAKAR